MAEPKSVASMQFPQVVWRNGHKYLWNPIHRKALKNRPEERVRLRVLEYLIHGGWSKHRISTEEAIDLPRKEASLRTDLICYTREFNPFLLIECKAENITLSNQTAEQIARYNQGVEAPYLLMTNGRTDHWYALNQQQVQPLNDIPEALPALNQPETNITYWQSCAFAGSDANYRLRRWMNHLLSKMMLNGQPSLLYISFNNSPTDIDLQNYYAIYTLENHRLALGCTATEFGSSRLIGILNRNGQNEALLQLNLNLLFDDKAPNATIYWAGDTTNIDVRKVPKAINSTNPNPAVIAEIISRLLFDIIDK